jgi:hypothetical protein
MTDCKSPGAALAVVQDSELALAKADGHRNIEANLPVTTATQFVICSITKSFTASGVALLHNDGHSGRTYSSFQTARVSGHHLNLDPEAVASALTGRAGSSVYSAGRLHSAY